jgi:hypothetical protein
VTPKFTISDLKFEDSQSSTVIFKEFTMAADSEAECYFCGNPKASKRCTRCKVALYCSAECQVKHWKLGRKEDCRAAASEQEGQNHSSSITTSIHKADCYFYIDTLPGLEEDEFVTLFAYHVVAAKDSSLAELANSIDYSFPGPGCSVSVSSSTTCRAVSSPTACDRSSSTSRRVACTGAKFRGIGIEASIFR